MINSIFSRVNNVQTINKAKGVLSQYKDFKKLTSILQIQSSISAQVYDDMPKAQDNKNHQEESLLKKLEVPIKHDQEVKMVEATIKVMGEANDHQLYLSKLLEYRFIKGWKVDKCAIKLAELHIEDRDFIGETTFNDHQKEALLLFMMLYRGGTELVLKEPKKSGVFPVLIRC